MKSLGWRVTWQNIKVRYCFNHFYLTFVPKLKFCSNDVTTSKSRKLMSVDCTNNESGIFYHLHDLVCVCSRQQFCSAYLMYENCILIIHINKIYYHLNHRLRHWTNPDSFLISTNSCLFSYLVLWFIFLSCRRSILKVILPHKRSHDRIKFKEYVHT